MPVTPFHLGPGALLAAAAPGRVSLTAFVAVNALIDLEPLSGLLLTGDPAHRFFHTLLGATLLAVAVAWPGRRLGEAWLRAWNRGLGGGETRWLGSALTIAPSAAWLGAIVGAWSHVGLDAAMHRDVEALWPFVEGNPIHAWMPLSALHTLCLVSAGAALLVFALRRRTAKS